MTRTRTRTRTPGRYASNDGSSLTSTHTETTYLVPIHSSYTANVRLPLQNLERSHGEVQEARMVFVDSEPSTGLQEVWVHGTIADCDMDAMTARREPPMHLREVAVR